MKKQKNNQSTAKETDFPVCRFSAEDCELLMSVGIDPMGDVPDEVLQLIKMGVPVLWQESTVKLAAPSDSKCMKKYFLPLESLFCHFPVKVSDELRYRGEGELRYCNFALFVRKDSDRLMTVESKDGETIFRSLFYLLPASVAETFTRIYDEEDIERGYDDLTLHLFREAGDGSVDYTESCLRIGEVLEQSALKKTLPANCQSDDVFVVPLHFPECVCPVCGKTTIPQNSFGAAICPVCGWCELRMEDEMSESARRGKYAEQLALDPNFMYDDPIDGYGFICPLCHRKGN